MAKRFLTAFGGSLLILGLYAVGPLAEAVPGINTPPVAGPDNFSMLEEATLNGTVGTNDTDAESPDNDLVWSLSNGGTAVANGSLILNTNGTFSYSPNVDVNGSVQFTYEVCDPGGACATATATIAVDPVNDAPTADNDAFSMLEDGGLSDNVGGNDADVDNTNGQLLWSILNGGTAAANGQLFFNPSGGFTYVPDPDHVGPVVFTYRVCDPSGACADATVSIAVAGVNDAPGAADDNATTSEEVAVDIAVTGNDTDGDGNVDAGTVSILFPPGNGTVSIGIGGVISYDPNDDFVGTDQFTYQVCDDGTPLPNACDNATVTIEVLNVNDAPIATGEAYFTDEDGFSITSNVAGNDFDPDNSVGQLTYTLFDGLDAVLHGSLTVDTDGTIGYDPMDNYNGNVSFIYQVCDPGGLCDLATVLLFVLPVNDPIIVLDDVENTAVDLPIIINVIANDSDPNDPAGGVNAQSVVIIVAPFNGLATANANGTITYEPGPGYSGLDSAQYTVCDLGDAAPVSCDTAWLVILMDNTHPLAVDDSYVIDEDADSTLLVLANDVTPIGVLVPSTIVVIDPPSNGTAMVNVDGTISYVPNANYNGVDDFNYQVCNDLGLCSTGTVTVAVAAVNDPPVADADGAITAEETNVVVEVLINDSEPIDNPGDIVASSVVITAGPANGVASVGIGGTIDYTPATDFNGTDTVVYSVCDDGFPLPGACDTAIVVFEVTPVNDHPVIAGDTLLFTGNEDVALLICVPTSDVDGDTLDITSVVSGPFSGAVSGIADGDTCILYTPDADFFGNDTLIVNVCDPNGACDQAVVVISVLPANDPPVILDGSGLPADTVLASTAEETLFTICLDALDIDGDPLQVTDFLNGPFNGFVTGFADGDTCFTYTPNVDYNGSDTVSIVVCDGNGGCDTVVVVMDVMPVNDEPVIEDGNGSAMDTLSVSTLEDTPINLCLPVSDADGDPVDVTTYFDGPAYGSIFNILDGNPCFTYAPVANYNGPDTVSVVVSDGNGGNDTLVVFINVLPANDVPVIVDGGGSPIETISITTIEDTPIIICLDAVDTDVDTLDIVDILNGPGNGQVTGVLDGDTCFTYSPNTDWTGTDTMTVVVCDSNNGCDSVLVIISVTPVNDDPVIIDNGGSPIDTLDIYTAVDQPVTICLDAIDADGDTLDVATIFNGPDSAAVSGVLDGDTCFTYAPNLSFEGTDTMTVVIEDGAGGADTVVVIVNVTPNEPPVADSDTVNITTPEDTPILICIGATDPDGDPLDVTAVQSGPANGTVLGLLDGDTCFTYVPALDWSGVDTVVVTVCDQFNDCDEVTVIVSVTPVNDVPVITDGGGLPIDSVIAVTPEDTQIVICLDAIDADGDILDVVSVVNGPLNGQVSGMLNGDTCFTYIPNANWNGTDSMSVVVCDDNGGCDTVVVFIDVTPLDDVPVITDGGTPVDTLSATTPQDIPVTICIDAIDADGDTLDVVGIINGPDSGSVTGVLDGDTCFTYTPNAGYFGADTLTAIVCDGTGLCDTVVVVIAVIEVIPNQPPIAVDDTAATLEDTSVAVDVLDNDSDPDGDPLTVTGAVAGNGTVTINGNGSITYVPDPGWCGTDTITYTVCDPFGLCDDAIVIVDVACVNAPPIAVDDISATTPGVVITIDVLDNDSDPDDDPITVINASAVNGSVLVNGDGTVTYTPNVGFCGVDTLTYTISDGNGGTDTAIVIIDVPCPNEPPIAVDDSTGFSGDGALVIDVLDNDSDPDGDPLTITEATAVNGSVSIVNGTLLYDPDAGFCGTDTITYTICDDEPLCDSAIVLVEVECPDNSLVVPSGFSPNGDGIADTWVVQNLHLYPAASVIIFNRWGSEVFSADPYLNDWTGVSQHALTIGDVLPAGTYWYLLDLGVEGEEVRSGYIYLNK